jgi:hypothetical protein
MGPPEKVRQWNDMAAGEADPVRMLLEETYERGDNEEFIPTQEIRAMLEQIGRCPSDTTIKGYMKTLFGVEKTGRGTVKGPAGTGEQVRGYYGIKRK